MTIKNITLIIVTISSLCLFSCKKDSDNPRPEFKLEIADAISEEEYEIYSLVINDMWSDTIILQQLTSMDITSSEDGYSYRFLTDSNPDIDTLMFINFRFQNDSSCYLTNAFDCPDKHIVLISSSEIQYIFNGQDINNDWDEFYVEYPNSNGIVEFSRIGFNETHTQAILETGRQYASLGGVGLLVYLEKINNSWVIIYKFPTWIS